MLWFFDLSYSGGFEFIIYNLYVEYNHLCWRLLYLFQDFNPNVYGACMNMYMQVWMSMCVHLEATVPCQVSSALIFSIGFFYSDEVTVNEELSRMTGRQGLRFHLSLFSTSGITGVHRPPQPSLYLGAGNQTQVLRFAQHTLSHLLSSWCWILLNDIFYPLRRR